MVLAVAAIAAIAAVALRIDAPRDAVPPDWPIDGGMAALIAPPSEPVSLLHGAGAAVLQPVSTAGDLVWYRVAGIRTVPAPD